MEAKPQHELTLILARARAGDEGARDKLLAQVYDELRQVASGLMRRERADHTLSPTAVVNEAVIRLLGDAIFDKAADRSFLFASAARAMREVLIDHARRRAADRRGGGRRRVPLDAVVDYFQAQGLDLVAVHEALDRLAERDWRQAQVMTLRYFGGMTVPEVAAALGVSTVTVERDWRLARRLACRPAWRGRGMTPERWQQIGELFDAGVRIVPAEREAWLRAACNGDIDLRDEVSRLLAQDERADRDKLLTPPVPADLPPNRTASQHPQVNGHAFAKAKPITDVGETSADDTRGFTPRAAIAQHTAKPLICEPPEVVRARLRELPMIYIVMLAIALFWRLAVLASDDLTLYQVDVVIILALVGIIALLWSRWPIPLAGLKALELGMIGVMAGRLTFVQYRLMLMYSLRDDRMMAQLTMKNVVLLTSILILTYGLYVPKSWRRAALVAAPLALLPFATLMVLILQYPATMGWLWKGWMMSDTPRIPPLRLRCDDLAHARRRLDLRGSHNVSAAPPGRSSPAGRPVSPAAAARRRRDGRGLPGRAPAPEAPLCPQVDPGGRRDRPDSPRAV